MPHGGDFFLKGLEAEPWEPHCKGDLVVLSERPEQRDLFAQYLSDKIVPWYHRWIGHRMQSPVSVQDWGGGAGVQKRAIRGPRKYHLHDTVRIGTFSFDYLPLFRQQHDRATCCRIWHELSTFICDDYHRARVPSGSQRLSQLH